MKAQIDKLDEYIVKKGHLFGCKLVDDAKFFCQTNSALCSPYLLTHTHTLEILPQTLRSTSTLYCQNFQTDPSAAVSCHFRVGWMRPTSAPPFTSSFSFFLISNRIFGSFPLSSSTSFQIAPDSRPHQEDILVS